MEDELDFSKIPECDIIINHILYRLRRGLYTLVLVTGLPGTGKSSTCLRLKELIDSKRGIVEDKTKKTTIDSLLELLRALKDSSPGDVLVIEELSVLFPSRRSMAIDNVAIGRVLDTCRKKRVILFANAPLLNSIDSHIRALANVLIETLKVNRQEGVVISKGFRLQTSPRNSKTYLHRFLRSGRDVNLFYTRKPSSELWEKYELEKDGFIDKLYARLHLEQQKKGEKEDKALGITHDISGLESEEDKELYYLRYVKGYKLMEIGKIKGITPSSICRKLQRIERNKQKYMENQGIWLKNDTQQAIKLNLGANHEKNVVPNQEGIQ